MVTLKKKPEGGRGRGTRGVRMTSPGSPGTRTNRAEGQALGRAQQRSAKGWLADGLGLPKDPLWGGQYGSLLLY